MATNNNEMKVTDTPTIQNNKQSSSSLSSSNDFFTEQESQRISTESSSIRENNPEVTNSMESSSNKREEEEAPSPKFKRLLPRDLPFHQSSNVLQIQNIQKSNRQRLNMLLLKRDWFHRFLRLPTYYILFFLLAIWTVVVLLFALLYMAVDRNHPNTNCGLTSDISQSIAFAGAFAFSLETCTTVGYGLPDTNAFFNNCPELQVCIYFQMVFSMVFNAFLFSYFFAGVSRCSNRGAQVLFSNKAILRRVVNDGERRNGGRYVLEVQIYDVGSSHALVEAHVRFYAIRRCFPAAAADTSSSSRILQHHYLKFDPMRILSPDDELGAVLYSSVPYSVTHHIDAYSPILPPLRRDLYQNGRIHKNSNFVLDSAGLPLNLREVDSFTGNRDALQCTVCGETYGTTQNLVRHIRMCQLVEQHDDYPIKGSHRELDVALIVNELLPKNDDDGDAVLSSLHSHQQGLNNTIGGTSNGNATYDDEQQFYSDVREYLTTSQIEILCVFEAIEPLFSGTFQCMQSYTMDDIVFGGEFAPCMLYGEEEEIGTTTKKGRTWWRRFWGWYRNDNVAARVDLDRFHEIVN